MEMADFTKQSLLVTGASGHFGQLAVEELVARGASRVIAGTRDPAKLERFKSRGVEVRKIDFDDTALAEALVGVDRMLMISTDAIGTRIEQQAFAATAAKAAGVKHIVYTSAPSPRPNAGSGAAIDHYWTEQAIAATGLDFTFMRNHIYTEITLMGAAAALGSGQLFDATDGRGRAYVTRADAARAAAGALLTSGGKSIHDVTGPAAITQEELAALLAELSGKPVTRVGLTGEQLRQGLAASGVPEGMAHVLVAFDRDAAEGYHAVVSDTVERFSGRQPQSVRDFLVDNRAALSA
jgi:NAD(P)H dehydrogenase (quinone)